MKFTISMEFIQFSYINMLKSSLFALYSHSIVAGGFDVKSYITLDIPGTELTLSAILSTS